MNGFYNILEYGNCCNFDCTKRGTIDNLDRMTFSPTKDIAIDLSKKMQTQVSDDGNGYTSGKIYSYSSYLDGLMYIEDV